MKPRLGLALGAGSARGWAHIGVIRALAAAGVAPEVVCGTSIGAFVGASYASGELDRSEAWVRSLSWKDMLGFIDVGFSGGLIKGEKLMSFFSEHLVDRDFGALTIPFACVATDLASGREIWLRDGSVVDAVRASIALPGLFSPQLRDGRFLVDGGLVNPVPVSLCRALGAEVVIAVDLGSDVVGRRLRRLQNGNGFASWGTRVREWLGRPAGDGPPPPGMVDVVTTGINIMQIRIARSRLAGEPADVLVAPRLAQLGLLDFDHGEEAIEEGAEAMRQMLPLVQRLLVSA